MSSNLLTEREFEVLKYIVKGLSNTQIAHELVIEPDTVKAHISSILRKFNLKSRITAVVQAIKTGIIDVNEIELPTRED